MFFKLFKIFSIVIQSLCVGEEISYQKLSSFIDWRKKEQKKNKTFLSPIFSLLVSSSTSESEQEREQERDRDRSREKERERNFLVVTPAVHICEFPEAWAPVVEVIVILVPSAAGGVDGAEGACRGAAALVVKHQQGVVRWGCWVVIGGLQSLCREGQRMGENDLSMR